eukprot:1747443-Rhodomonas_salina.1
MVLLLTPALHRHCCRSGARLATAVGAFPEPVSRIGHSHCGLPGYACSTLAFTVGSYQTSKVYKGQLMQVRLCTGWPGPVGASVPEYKLLG